MKVIFSIAKNEFRYLFYSPIAWFAILVFLIQCAVFYSERILGGTNYQEIMLQNSHGFKGFGNSLTTTMFLKGEFFPVVINNLYLFIPILTMGLISREANNSTSALLYSSPVNIRRIVLGKYIGIMMYNLLFILVISIFLIAGFFSIQHVDYGVLLSAALGFYLLVCAYSAIGLFMSSLSNYQVISALAIFISIFVLSRIGDLWQRYDFVRDLTYFLSLQNRTLKMLSGLIVTKDVLYFLLVSMMFVAFTLIKLRNNRDAKSWYLKAGRYLAVLAVVLMAGYISSRPLLTGYLDTTATQRNTIHPKTQKNLRELGDSTLEVTLYANLLGGGFGRSLPEVRNADYLANLWESYLRFKPDIRFKYVYYYDYDPSKDDSLLFRQYPGKDLKTIAAENAASIDADLSMFLAPDEIRRMIDLGPENYRLVIQLKYKGRTALLRTFDDIYFWPDQTNMNAALRRLLDPEVPHIAFVTGELERSIVKLGEREYANHSASKTGRETLVNIGFDVDTVNLVEQDIPKNITALVLADPKKELSLGVLGKLRNYIHEGGNLLITGEPGKQYVLNPMLKQLGIQLMNGQIVQPSYDETPDKVWSYITEVSSGLSEGLSWRKNAKTDDFMDVLTPGATGIIYTSDSSFHADTLTVTRPGSAWLKAGPVVIDSILPPFNAQEGDIQLSSFPTVIHLSRRINGKEQRIIIAGDADFASNKRLSEPFNFTFLIPVYSWLAYNRFPVYTPGTLPKDVLFTISAKAAGIQKIVFVWVLPSVILLAGTILLIRRKRK